MFVALVGQLTFNAFHRLKLSALSPRIVLLPFYGTLARAWSGSGFFHGHVHWLIIAKMPAPHRQILDVTHLATLAVQRVVDLRPALDVLQSHRLAHQQTASLVVQVHKAAIWKVISDSVVGRKYGKVSAKPANLRAIWPLSFAH